MLSCEGNSFWPLVSACSFFWSWPRAHGHKSGLGSRSTCKLKALTSILNLQRSGTTAFLLQTRHRSVYHSPLLIPHSHFPSRANKTTRYLNSFAWCSNSPLNPDEAFKRYISLSPSSSDEASLVFKKGWDHVFNFKWKGADIFELQVLTDIQTDMPNCNTLSNFWGQG